jgi:hypothetical protein
MVLTELFLNFAHEVLRGGVKKLESVYHPDKYPNLNNKENKELWTDAFTAYNSFQGIPDQIANHYGNPTDFENDLDLQLAEYLRAKAKDIIDPIDILFYSVNQYYPWQTNVPTRWYQEKTTL